MKRHRVLQLHGFEILEARDLVMAWGFPRPIFEQELVSACWFRYGPGIFWVIADAECAEGEAGVHIASPPEARGTIDRVEWLRDLYVVLDLLGIDAVNVELRGEKIEALAARYGWTQRGARWYFSLQG